MYLEWKGEQAFLSKISVEEIKTIDKGVRIFEAYMARTTSIRESREDQEKLWFT